MAHTKPVIMWGSKPLMIISSVITTVWHTLKWLHHFTHESWFPLCHFTLGEDERDLTTSLYKEKLHDCTSHDKVSRPYISNSSLRTMTYTQCHATHKDITRAAPSCAKWNQWLSHRKMFHTETLISPFYQVNVSTSTIQIIWQALPCQSRGGTVFLGPRTCP
jgi:hypothetical protein